MRPGRGLLRLLALWTVLGVAASLWPPLLWIWGGAGLALLGVAGWSWRFVRRLPEPSAERRVAGALPLGAPSPVTVRLTNRGSHPLDLEVFDHHPETAEPEGLPRRIEVPPKGWAEVAYRLRPLERGDRSFGPVGLLVRSPGDLWRRPMRVGSGETVKVIPAFQAVSRYALLALSDPLGRIGVKVNRRRGEGSEFEQLRDYRPGDSLRRIDWKATSRRGQLISREYSEERNQQVVCLIDCGRRMRARDGEIGHFDQVLNSVLLLSFVALRQGDAVGVMTFSGERRWLPPAKGRRALGEILHRVYDLQTTNTPSDFLEAATELMIRQRRRALVVVLSNLRDEDSAELTSALGLLRTRHLVLLASLRETALRDRLEQLPHNLSEALTVAAVHRYLESRQRAFDALGLRGTLTVDVEPELLPARIVNRYLEVKRSGLL